MLDMQRMCASKQTNVDAETRARSGEVDELNEVGRV